MTSKKDEMIDELTAIKAHCDQVQADITLAREKFDGLEYIQRQLDLSQITLDSQLSKINIALAMIKRNLS